MGKKTKGPLSEKRKKTTERLRKKAKREKAKQWSNRTIWESVGLALILAQRLIDAALFISSSRL